MFKSHSYRIGINADFIPTIDIETTFDPGISDAALNSIADILATEFSGTVSFIFKAEQETVTIT